MFEDGDDVTKATDAHVKQVFLGQVQEHVPLNAIIIERNCIVCRVSWRDTSISEKLDPVGSAIFCYKRKYKLSEMCCHILCMVKDSEPHQQCT